MHSINGSTSNIEVSHNV